jgi:hypothetical protein
MRFFSCPAIQPHEFGNEFRLLSINRLTTYDKDPVFTATKMAMQQRLYRTQPACFARCRIQPKQPLVAVRNEAPTRNSQQPSEIRQRT